MTLMLGGNDLLQGPPFVAEDAAARMDTCLTALLTQRAPSTVLLVSPPAPMLGVLDQCRPVPPGCPPGPLLPGLAAKREVAFADAGGLGGGAAL